MQKVVHGKAPQYLKDLMIPSERLHVHWNKQLLPRTRIDIFKTSFSFSGSLAWNSLPHHLRYPMELKTFKGKAFQSLAKPPWYFFIILVLSFFLARQTTWHKMYRILLFSLPCSCEVLYLYFIRNWFFKFYLNLYFHEMFTLFLFHRGQYIYICKCKFCIILCVCVCVWCALILVRCV